MKALRLPFFLLAVSCVSADISCVANHNFILFGDDYSAIDSQDDYNGCIEYTDWRRSNGWLWPVYAEHDASSLNTTIDNRAWAGATAYYRSTTTADLDVWCDPAEYPRDLLVNQVYWYLYWNPTNLTDSDCVLMWIGVKDLWNYFNTYRKFPQDSYITNVVNSIETQIRRLKNERNAKCFILGDLMDLKLVPALAIYGKSASAVSTSFNSKLKTMSQKLQADASFSDVSVLKVLNMTKMMNTINPPSASSYSYCVAYPTHNTCYSTCTKFWLSKLYPSTIGHKKISDYLLNTICAETGLKAAPIPDAEIVASFSHRRLQQPAIQGFAVQGMTSSSTQGWVWVIGGVATGVALMIALAAALIVVAHQRPRDTAGSFANENLVQQTSLDL